MNKKSSIKILLLLFIIQFVLLSWDVQGDCGSMQSLALNSDSISEGWLDGPHYKWLNDNWIKMTYYKYNEENGEISKKVRFSRQKEDEFYIEGKFGDERSYFLEKELRIPEYEYKDVNDIFVVGDVHGEYHKLISLLKKSGIINAKLEWQYGQGHLVFMGDIFDKGQSVTECLWFIKGLSPQAEKAGGKIHKIIGNHEIMNLTKVFHYNTKKYELLRQEYPKDFNELYGINTELGSWIRTWSSVLKIDDKLFVHGGISPQFLKADITKEEINTLIRKYLNGEIHNQDTSKVDIILENYGPFMYRGYLKEGADYPLISEIEIDRILEDYGVRHIIFGHTERKQFSILFDKKLIGIDVPLRFKGISEQALHFIGKDIYKVYSDGSKIKI